MHRRRKWLIFALLLLAGLGAVPSQERSVAYERYDVDIEIQADGSLLVAETYQLRFEGEFREGFTEMPLDFVTDIVNVQVLEDDVPYSEAGYGPGTYSVDREWDTIYVEWEFEPTSGTEVRTFTVKYRVVGGLWVYPDGDRLSWKAVPADRGGIPVEASRVTVRLPEPVPSVNLSFQSHGAETRAEPLDAQTVVFEALDSIPDGTVLDVEVRFPHGLTATTAQDWQRAIDAEELVYRWEALEVDLALASDGTLAVTEAHTLAVDESVLYLGHRVINRLYLDEITDVEVWQGERAFELSADPCDYCYVVEEEYTHSDWVAFDGSRVVIREDRAGSTLVEWAFPAVVAGETTAFRLSYTALGTVRVLTDAQEIFWTAVFADRDVDVEKASVRLYLPPGVRAEQVAIEGGATSVESDGALRVVHDGPVPPGEAWQVRIRLPVGATTAEKSSWQRALERELNEEQAYVEQQRRAEILRARWQLTFGLLGILFPILGLVGVLVAWYVWGRDRPTPVVAEYLTEPPSDLPPGIVAYLVDEEPTVKGVLADLLHLATLGLISVDLREPDFTVTLNWEEGINEGKGVRVPGGEEVVLTEHERTLFNTLAEALKKEEDRQHPFSRIQSVFTRALPRVYEQMGEAATQYFSMLPEEARRRWNWTGQRLVIAAFALALVGLCMKSWLGWVAFAPQAGLAVVGLMLMAISHWMPQRTTLGVEEAERWRAFRRYLRNLKRYGDVEAAQAMLDRYFSYAVALDVEEVLLRQAEDMGARVPAWIVPVPVQVSTATPVEVEQRRGLAGRRASLMPRPGGRVAEAAIRRAARVRPSLAKRPVGADLSLDGLSRRLGRSLDRASHSLGSLLDTAVGHAESSPFEVVMEGAGEAAKTATRTTWQAGKGALEVLGDILEYSASGGGGGGYSGGSSSRSSSSGSSFRSRSWSSSSRSSSRSSSSSRRSGGGGRRGFR
jgi:hypothetical protein